MVGKRQQLGLDEYKNLQEGYINHYIWGAQDIKGPNLKIYSLEGWISALVCTSAHCSFTFLYDLV
jgi:hypothetical protein